MRIVQGAFVDKDGVRHAVTGISGAAHEPAVVWHTLSKCGVNSAGGFALASARRDITCMMCINLGGFD